VANFWLATALKVIALRNIVSVFKTGRSATVNAIALPVITVNKYQRNKAKVDSRTEVKCS